MFDMNEFMTALQSGTNPDDIAKSFTDTLNAAVKAQKEAEEKANAEKTKRAAREKKVAAMADIVCDIEDFVKLYYADMYDEKIFDEIDPAGVVDAFDEAYEAVKALEPLLNSDLFKDMVKADAKKNNADKAISDFLSKYGL